MTLGSKGSLTTEPRSHILGCTRLLIQLTISALQNASFHITNLHTMPTYIHMAYKDSEYKYEYVHEYRYCPKRERRDYKRITSKILQRNGELRDFSLTKNIPFFAVPLNDSTTPLQLLQQGQGCSPLPCTW